ncbi:chemotaxis protein CheA [Duganella fentianensis]|uniref:chemotaxis protein CheA n=1 Tax=Duganella fentianensis TaxID=2692177 RepID=UPI0032B16D7B
MNPLLEQFVLEARDFLQGIGTELMALEADPANSERMTDLFRLVHTLKGNSGLFDFPVMTALLHAGEDLMDAVRDGRTPYGRELADLLLDAMDLVGSQIDEIDAHGILGNRTDAAAQRMAAALRQLIPARVVVEQAADAATAAQDEARWRTPVPALEQLDEAERMTVWRHAAAQVPLYRLLYAPDSDCFFKGEDPFHQMRQAPSLAWGAVHAPDWAPLAELDCYQCQLTFDGLLRCTEAEIQEHFRYVPEQIRLQALPLAALALPQGRQDGGPDFADFIAVARDLLAQDDYAALLAACDSMLDLCAADLWRASALRWLQLALQAEPVQQTLAATLVEALQAQELPAAIAAVPQSGPAGAAADASATPAAATRPGETAASAGIAAALSAEDKAVLDAIAATQARILSLPDDVGWLEGRLQGCATTLRAMLLQLGLPTATLEQACSASLMSHSNTPLAQWLENYLHAEDVAEAAPPAASGERASEEEVRFGRRAEDHVTSKVLKVDQVKVDRLMDLIGEMVVAKNSLPYLANRAENQFGVRELSREIKAQYAVINRIAEEMQDAIMQVRMMPVSFVFQRFPRMVRDISRKLGKEVELVLEGEETEADKNMVEMLADPLVHIVRNSLDHGLEAPDVRQQNGKPRQGRLLIRAAQEADRVVIEVIDDGRGIDPQAVRRKALEQGVIDSAQFERISDQEAINLVFAAGFSTAAQVSDLSGRGVGMDAVRNALEKVGGTVQLQSTVGVGTTIRLSLPLSMAVTNVMIIESDGQIFGVPMDSVVETVRLPMSHLRAIKQQQTVVLRGKIVPVMALNTLLAIDVAPQPNADGEVAALVVRLGGDHCALLVDNFREVVDVILKPLPGELARLRGYAGTALLGDGSVLMVLNPKELF